LHLTLFVLKSIVTRASTDIGSLTGLRGLAAWYVVLFHVQDWIPTTSSPYIYKFFSQGFLAVDLFFILSGFVIHRAYSSKFSPFYLGAYFDFIFRRLARIYPLHLFCLFLYVFVPLAIVYLSTEKELGERFSPSYLFQSLLLIQNWGFSSKLDWNYPAWSISVEFFAYLLFPFLMLLINPTSKRFAFFSFIGIPVLCVVISFIFFSSGRSSLGDDIPLLGLVRCLLEFSIGTLISNVCKQSAISNRPLSNGLQVLSIIIISLGFYFKAPDYCFIPFAFSLFIFSLVSGETCLGMFLSFKCLIFIGKISYSTYLCHALVREIVKFSSSSLGVVQVVYYCTVVAGVSILLFFLIEEPARLRLNKYFDNWKNNFD
jgi:peptidoglycan/LPS O-acetylase OafA/YrhL